MKTNMNSREQFLKTINHRQPDRIVLDFGGTPVTGIHVQTISKLRRHYGLQRKPIRLTEPYQMLGEVGWELIDSIGIDVIGAWGKNNLFGFNNHSPFKEWKTPWGQRIMVPMNFNVTYDSDDNVFMHPQGNVSLPPSSKMPASGFRFNIIPTVDSISEEEVDAELPIDAFNLINEKELEHWRIEVDKAYFSGKAIVADLSRITLGDFAMISEMQLRQPNGIRNATDWFKKAIDKPDFLRNLIEKQSEIAIENLKRLFSVTGNKISVVFVGGADLGSIDPGFSSLEMLDEVWLPYYKKINSWIHQNTQWKSVKYSNALTIPLLEGFLNADFDIINPGQTETAGIELKQLKDKYGKYMVIWGGGINSLNTLSVKTPAEIREQVLKNCEILMKNGGFVFSPDYNIQANVPAENMVALLEAIQEFNGR